MLLFWQGLQCPNQMCEVLQVPQDSFLYLLMQISMATYLPETCLRSVTDVWGFKRGLPIVQHWLSMSGDAWNELLSLKPECRAFSGM